MNTSFFHVSLKELLDALVFGIVMGVISAILYVLGVGNVFGIDFHNITNAFSLAFLGAVLTFLKSLLTTSNGNVIGVTPKQ